MDTQKFLTYKHVLVKAYAGSHSYGTSLPSSDVDFRGIFCSDPINVRTSFFNVMEVDDKTEEDTKLYELAHYMKLYLDGNPNILEVLWVDDADILTTSPGYEILREHRADLLSSKIAFTTTGYASAQIKRIKGHNKWINNPQSEEPPHQKDFISLVQWFGKTGIIRCFNKFIKARFSEKVLPRDFNITNYNSNYTLIPYGNEIYGLYEKSNRKVYNNKGEINTIYNIENRHLMGYPIAIVKFNKEEYRRAKDNWKNYWTWKKNRNLQRSALEEKYGYDCYSDDTEFLTNDGWKWFDEISNTDLLATFSLSTHKIEYQKYIERFDGTFTGNMYYFKGQHTDILVTPNHKMYIKEFSRKLDRYSSDWSFVEAARLPDCFDTLHTINPKSNRQKLPNNFDLNVLNHMNIASYLRIIGWYISDGTCAFGSDGTAKQVIITQSKPQSRLTQNLNRQRNLGKIQCTERVYKASGISNFPEKRWFFKKDISILIYKDCGHKSENKRIPQWCFDLTKREMNILLTALLQGDGTTRNHQEETYIYYTNNSNLADDVQRLAFLCGFETSKWGPYEYTRDAKDRNGVMFQVHINKKPQKTKRRYRSLSIEKINVTDKRIVCFMTPNHTLVTRRNGKIALQSNSKHAMHCVRLMRMGEEILTQGEVIVKRPDAAELLDIRDGAWSYERLLEYAEYMDDLIRNKLYKETDLPKRPNVKLAAELVMKVQDLVWNK